jgi:trk system potassium uptake protein TrkH
MVLTILKNEIRRILHPRAVLPVKVNNMNVPYSSQVTLLAFLAAYMMLCLFTYIVMTVIGIDSTNSITIAISCASNAGPALDLGIGQPMTWGILPDAIKWLLAALMLMGRLEILSVVVLFTPAFWKDN